MVNIQKKIKYIITKAFELFKKYLPHIVLLVFTFQIFAYIYTLPYFNTIGNFYYFLFGALWLIGLYLFRKYITGRRILYIAFLLFIFGIPVQVFGIEVLNDALGFGAFIILFTYVMWQIIFERKTLRETK